MAYHISGFINKSDKDVVTANPASQRDTYFIATNQQQKPDHNVLINKGTWTSYDKAFPEANFIYTGTQALCFWDNGNSEILGMTAQDSSPRFLFSHSAENVLLVIGPDGNIQFSNG